MQFKLITLKLIRSKLIALKLIRLKLIQWHLSNRYMWKKDVERQKRRQHLVVDVMTISDLTNSTRLRLWQPYHSGNSIIIIRS